MTDVPSAGQKKLPKTSQKDNLDLYELLRPADQYETLHVLLHENLSQSNIVVTASYESSKALTLSPEIVFPTLRETIKRHPALSIIAVDHPSDKIHGKFEVWLARLKTINLDDCVFFVHGYDTNLKLGPLIERQHNEWFNLKDLTKPLWKVTVVNGIHIIFTYSHFIGDGKGGLSFHRSFLRALEEVIPCESITKCNKLTTTSKLPLAQESMALLFDLGYTRSQLRVAISYLYILLVKLLLPPYMFIFFSSQQPQTTTKPEHVLNSPTTRLHSFSLNPSSVSQATIACRSYGTSFTSLLNTLVLVTLATDTNENSRFAVVFKPVDLRRYLQPQITSEDDIRNLTASFTHKVWLRKFRDAGRRKDDVAGVTQHEVSHLESGRNAPNIVPLNKERFWKVAADDNAFTRKQIDVKGRPADYTPPTINSRLSMSVQPRDKETYASKVLSKMPGILWGSISVSNLGIFETSDLDMVSEQRVSRETVSQWEIVDAEFSFGAYSPAMGYIMYVGAVSTLQGGCKVNVSVNKDIVSDMVVKTMINGIEGRLE